MDNPVFKLEGVVHERSAETLQDFEGPLDLILFLLSKNKIEIQDIPIALILDQYLAYLEQRKSLDLEVASEFITMAAHLMYIKTRMLLSLEDEQAQSEMDELIASLNDGGADVLGYAREGTVYPMLYRLQESGLIACRMAASPANGGTKKYYSLTEAGRDALRALTAFWKDYAACVNRFIEPEDKP